MRHEEENGAHRLSVERPRLSVVGLLVLWGCAGMLFAGVTRYDGPLLWLGVAGVLLVGAARWRAIRNLRDLEFFRRRPPRVFAGEIFALKLRVRHSSPSSWWQLRSGCGLEIRDGLMPKRGPALCLGGGLLPGEEAEGVVFSRWFRRGRELRADFELYSDFPLGLFEVRARGTLHDETVDRDGGLVVYPQPILPESLRQDLELERFDLGSRHGIEPEPGEEYRGIREYRRGDPVKSVHWAATARAGRPMVREWDPPAPRPARYGLLLHTWEEGGTRLLRPDDWELGLRIATGLMAHCRENGIGLWFADESGPRVRPILRIPESATFAAGLERLALVRRGRLDRFERLQRALETLLPGCDRVFVVSDVPRDRWQSQVENAVRGDRVVYVDPETVSPFRRRFSLPTGRSVT